ncbi:IclR family transcriptional regulator [Glutamicibacter sp. MNS18]|uniref:IclR family transcriptional regulator n=1 Tax=Glutamicibacter sp. MNS18 TaxID=2989817 RepID=UPI00223666D6|nr:IclR family transcriptional regulator [Glutamicibacter sp. MNS18]MCW4466928.1 IclR family transcriptional regulator [Glutamicibacter sp. MNS18]
MARSSAGISTLERAVRLLEAFAPGEQDLTQSQLASRAGIPLSSSTSLLRELVRLGLLERTEDRSYRIGVHLWELASGTPGVVGLRETALPHLQRLQASLGHHSQLGILDGAEVLFLERLSSGNGTVNHTLVGKRMPFYASSSGLVLAAHATPERRRELVALPRPRYAIEPDFTDQALRQLLAEIRKTGVHQSQGWVHPKSTALAVPVRGALGTVVGALAVVVPSDPQGADQRLANPGLEAMLLRTAAGLHNDLTRPQRS